MIQNMYTKFQRVVNVRKMRKVHERNGEVYCSSPGNAKFTFTSEFLDASGDYAREDDGDGTDEEVGDDRGAEKPREADQDLLGPEESEPVGESREEKAAVESESDEEGENNQAQHGCKRRLRERKNLRKPDWLQY